MMASKKKDNKKAGRRSSADSTYIYNIPFVRENENYVNASLNLKISGADTTFGYSCDWQYRQFQNTPNSVTDSAEKFAVFLMTLDKSVFGHTKFKIVDSNLFRNGSHRSYYVTLSEAEKLNGRNSVLIEIEVCQEGTIYWFEECPYKDSPKCEYGCDHCILCLTPHPYTYCWDDYADDGTGGGGGGIGAGGVGGGDGGSGSGGGSGGGTPPNCTPGQHPPCEPGWIPEDDGGLYNPNAGLAVFLTNEISSFDLAKINFWKNNNIDTIELDSCRRLLLSNLINSIGTNSLGVFLAKLDKALGIKNTLDKFILHFKIGALNNYDALTTNTFYDPINKEFEATITLDSSMTHNATDLFVMNTLVHEIIHAYMSYIWGKLTAGATQQQIASMQYDQIFNSYIDTIRKYDSLNPQVLLYESESLQHNYMSDKLLEYIGNIVKSSTNINNITDRYYWQLAWAGLTRKQVKTWKYHWPNFPNWPPLNPSPSEDSTRGLKYALTLQRIDTIYNQVLSNERYSLIGAKGRKPIQGSCY